MIRLRTPVTLGRLRKILDAYEDDAPDDSIVRVVARDIVVEQPDEPMTART